VRLEPSEMARHLREAADLAGLPLPEIVLPIERELLANGLRLHYLDWGTAGRQPILFLHGGSLTARTWDLVCLGLRRDYHCLALNLRGHGDSDWSPEADYSLEAHRGDLEALVDHLGLERFVLVGMSLGGAVSLTYAGKHAGKLAALVLVDVGPETREAGRRQIAEFVSGPRELDSIEQFVERAVAFNPLRRPELLRRSLLHNLRETPDGKWTWKYDPRRMNSATAEDRDRRRRELWAEVPKITCPALVVRGGNSENFLDEDAEKLAGALPRGSWVRIEGAGHTVQGDQPRALVEALRRFLGSGVDQAIP
jgi:esterase